MIEFRFSCTLFAYLISIVTLRVLRKVVNHKVHMHNIFHDLVMQFLWISLSLSFTHSRTHTHTYNVATVQKYSAKWCL
jgi:hypothetical protein